MDKSIFHFIVQALRRKEINPDQAKTLFAALREPGPVRGDCPPDDRRLRDDSMVKPGRSRTTDIAVIGMSGQFPDANDPDAFWENLIRGHDGVRELDSRYLDTARDFSSTKKPGTTYCRWGGILEERDCFDPLFFNISPREAESMSPHQRLILAESWKALEDAGYDPKALSSFVTGMYIGVEPTGRFYGSFTGSSDAIIASRLSYFLNLNGPALVVNTGCSSSGVAIHLACESLRDNESSLALAGGVFANMCRHTLVTLSEIDMLSRTGKCHTFDESSDGTVLSEGVGIVVLKRLDDAIAAGDHIYGVIKASGMNQDGASNGITAPNGAAQEELIAGVYKRYGVNPEEISYVEAHGTGTRLGDPVEANALVRAFRQFTARQRYCMIGSAKSHIGHTGAAAAVVGLIKILLAMRHRAVPGLINFSKLNPLIEFDGSPFYINTRSTEWRPENGRALTAALNSFGHSGTNVHLVVQEYKQPETGPGGLSENGPLLIPLSARNTDRLLACASGLAAFLRKSVVAPDREAGPVVDRSFQEAAEQRLRTMLSALLGVRPDEIDLEERFQEYGVDQQCAARLHAMVQEAFSVEMPPQIERDSIASMARALTRLGEPGPVPEHRKPPETEKCASPAIVPVAIRSTAYTLQTGREAMEERVAFLVTGVPELIQKLEAFAEGKEEIDFCWRGNARQGRKTFNLIASDEDMREAVEKWIAKGKFRKIAELWTQGFEIPWDLFYGTNRPVRASLPAYPFAKERYGAPDTKAGRSEQGVENAAQREPVRARERVIHPLVHDNTSDFSGQRFSSLFSGDEFFLADHVVKDQKLLPGVAYLEMAREAVALAAGTSGNGDTRIRLTNIVWARPVAVNGRPVKVHIALSPKDDGEISYQIYSQQEGNGAEPLVHSQGMAALTPGAEAPVWQLSSLLAGFNASLDASQCYGVFGKMGIQYGPGHRGIEKLYLGQGKALAKLSLPSSVSDTQRLFVLHPSLMDSAMQASIGLLIGPEGVTAPEGAVSLNPALPFALEELEVFDACKPSMWALVRHSAGSKAGDRVEKVDIDLCDDEGTVSVRMKGFSTRAAGGESRIGLPEPECAHPTGTTAGTIMVAPVWDQVSPGKISRELNGSGRVLIAGGTDEKRNAVQELLHGNPVDLGPLDTIGETATKLEAHGPIDHIVWMAPDGTFSGTGDDAFIEEQNRGVLQVFRMVKALLLLGYETRDLEWTIITVLAQPVRKDEAVNPAHAGIHGLTGSMAKEFPNWRVRLIDMDAAGDWPLPDIFALPPDRQGDAWAYRGGEWHRQKLIPVNPPVPERSLYRPGGVYVVIGGAGGIGEAWSEYMIRAYQAQIVWIGRRPKDAAIQAKLDRLASLGPAPRYISADATDREALQRACEEIRERYQAVNGVIHSAIALLDKTLANMDEERFRSGLAAKVDVCVRIAQVFRNEPLDFLLFFSGVMSFVKRPGQGNYAAGCTFKDAFAHRLSREWPCAVKIMNWGYWGGSGAVASKEYRDRMAQAGVGSLDPGEAMEALEALLAGPLDQIALWKNAATSSPPIFETDAEQVITVYPESAPSIIEAVQGRMPVPGERAAAMKADMGRNKEELEAFLCRLLAAQMQAAGLLTDSPRHLSDLTREAGVRDLYGSWVEESMRVLTEELYVQRDGELCSVAAAIDEKAVWNEWEEKKRVWMETPDLKAHVLLADATLRSLPDILTGRVPATDIMFPDSSMKLVEGIYKQNRLADFFNEGLADAVVAALEERIGLDRSARIRIIEIGAGTGGTSAIVFPKIHPYAGFIEEYCYTDLSKAFLMHAESEYGQQNPFLTCAIFDVEAAVAEQGIAAGEYDIAIATNVLHATKNIRRTIRNAKAVLKKNGLLLLNEMAGRSLFAHLTFGLLEGWWLSEDPAVRIPGCPALFPATWQRVLESEGFRSTFFPAAAFHQLGHQVIVTETDGIVRQKRPRKAERAEESDMRRTYQPETAAAPSRGDRGPEQKAASGGPVDEGAGVSGQMVEDHARTVIRESVAEALKMNESSIQDDRSFSEYGVDSIIAVKLINLINERVHIRLQTTVLFDQNSVDRLTRHLVREQRPALIASLRPEPSRSGKPREEARQPDAQAGYAAARPVFPAPNRRPQTRQIPVRASDPGPAFTFHDQRSCRRVMIERPGGVDDLAVIDAELPGLKEDEIRIAVRAFSLNFGDLLCVKGLYPVMPPYPFTPGFEASGVVTAAGKAVTSFRNGDAVATVLGNGMGGQASVITCPAAHAFPKPANLSFEEAAAIPVVAMTMINAFGKARLKKGERILIQTAAGGTGLIAVQLAQHYGGEIYATAGSRHKLDYLRRLGVHHTINYEETDFESEVMRFTGGRGVDVVINTLPGEALQKGLNCLSPGGRYIEIAMTALKSARSVDLSVLSSNQTFYSINLGKLAAEDPETVKDGQREMIRMIEQGIIRPTICEVFDFNRIGDAYRCLENRKNIGKIVVSIPAEPVLRAAETETAAAKTLSPKSASLRKDPIAIIGMSGRFAKSRTVNELWEHLSSGADLVEEVSRWDLSKHFPPEARYCRHGSFLEDHDAFDPLFFNISEIEATYMDPQQRIFLEESWKALEDAGYAGAAIDGRMCGIYVGCVGGDYQQLFGDQPPPQAFWGNAGSVIPARIAYYLNLQGPAIAVDTACSSSLVAVHLACQGLWAGETEMALAGGVFVQCTPAFHLAANRASMLSPGGHCHAFDDRADGFVPGEGAGVVVLKRLDEAVADGDHIYGVIRGTGINQDGTTNGITAPSANSQERLERHVYDTFGIDPGNIQMVEAHGTGTKLGDPIEYEALTRSFRTYTDKKEFCAIGSIKTNLGHTATAAGAAGLIKVLLSLQHGQIPPSLHFQSGNSNIDFKDSPFYVNTRLRDWEPGPGGKRCAAISSFGISGTNAHMVVEEGPPSARRQSERPGHLIVLSARGQEQLRQQAGQLLAYCRRNPDRDCGNISYTLLLGRKHFNHRLACVVRNVNELVTLLQKWLDKGTVLQIRVSELQENNHREQASLKRYGNECISRCAGAAAGDYLEQLSAISELYVQGYNLEFERLFADASYSRFSLPVYPFERKRCWVNGSAAAPEERAVSAGRAEAQPRAAGSDSRVRRRISEISRIPVEDLPEGKALNSMGFTSIEVITLRHLLEMDLGVFIPIALVNESRTIGEVEKELREIITAGRQPHEKNDAAAPGVPPPAQGASGRSDVLPAIVPLPAERYLPFPLSDLQESFLTGRKLRIGGDWTGCHIYFEMNVNNPDIYRLNKAWERLVEHHEMLRCVIQSDGTQKILEKVRPYQFTVADLRRKNGAERPALLEQVRRAMSHKVYEAGQWPLFEIRISLCPDQKCVVHVSIDEFIVDAGGVAMLMRQWQQLYHDPGSKLPDPGLSFRDYLTAVRKFEGSERFERDMAYWLQKLERMPGGPELSLKPEPAQRSRDDYFRTRLSGVLEESEWQGIKARAGKLGVSTTTVLLSVFIEVLRRRSARKTFSLVMTHSNRLPLHPRISEVLGPFTSTGIFIAEENKGLGFEERIRYNQERLWEDLDHASVSGIRALRELRAKRSIPAGLFLPVVFTSLVNTPGSEGSEAGDGLFQEFSFMVTQTPQVYLDHQAIERDGTLAFSWDVAEGYWGQEAMRTLFSDYCTILRRLSLTEGAWELDAFPPGITEPQSLQAPVEAVQARAPGLKLQAMPSDMFKPFPLTDQQQAYAFGRTGRVQEGNNASLFYQEMEAEDLDIDRLETAWRKVMKTHEMLVTEILPDGTQKILEHVPEFKIKRADLTGRAAEEVRKELGATRQSMIGHVYSLGAWPYFDLRVSVLDKSISRIHFNIDLLLADGTSIFILLKQLYRFYQNPAEEPKKPDFLFRDYVICLRNYGKTEEYGNSMRYWENKFRDMPPGPLLPLNPARGENAGPGHEQLRGTLSRWKAFKDKAEELSVSPSMILLTVYAEVLGAWLDHEPFTLVIPSWERLPLHPDIDTVVGDFTAMSWLVIQNENETFSEKVRRNHGIVQKDLEHRAVSGLKALRKAVMRGGPGRKLSFPVVFTNMMTGAENSGAVHFRCIEALSRTPQVCLDNISVEQAGELHFHWDVARGVYPGGMIEEMFSGYTRALEKLANDVAAWQNRTFDEVIEAHPERYGSTPAGRRPSNHGTEVFIGQ